MKSLISSFIIDGVHTYELCIFSNQKQKKHLFFYFLYLIFLQSCSGSPSLVHTESVSSPSALSSSVLAKETPSQLHSSSVSSSISPLRITPLKTSSSSSSSSSPAHCTTLIQKQRKNTSSLKQSASLIQNIQKRQESFLWIPPPQVRMRAEWMDQSWIERAGLRFNLQQNRAALLQLRDLQTQTFSTQHLTFSLHLQNQFLTVYSKIKSTQFRILGFLTHLLLFQHYQKQLNPLTHAGHITPLQTQQIKLQIHTLSLSLQKEHLHLQSLLIQWNQLLTPTLSQDSPPSSLVFPMFNSCLAALNLNHFQPSQPSHPSSFTSLPVLQSQLQLQKQHLEYQKQERSWIDFIDLEWDRQNQVSRGLISLGITLPWVDEDQKQAQINLQSSQVEHQFLIQDTQHQHQLILNQIHSLSTSTQTLSAHLKTQDPLVHFLSLWHQVQTLPLSYWTDLTQLKKHLFLLISPALIPFKATPNYASTFKYSWDTFALWFATSTELFDLLTQYYSFKGLLLSP